MRELLLFVRNSFLISFLFIYSFSIAQQPAAQVKICNDTLLDSKNYQFDVYVRAKFVNGVHSLNLKGFQGGFQDSLKNVKGTGSPTVSVVSGSSNFGTNPDQRPTTAYIRPLAANPYYIQLNPAILVTNGMTIYDSASDPLGNAGWIKACSIRLINTVDYIQAPMQVLFSKSGSYPNVIQANYYISGTYYGLQIPIDTLNQLYNPVLNASINKYNFTGTSSYLANTNGVSLTLNGSQIGCAYKLMCNGVLLDSTEIIGNGNSIVWNYNLAGVYNVVSRRIATYIKDTMIGTAIVTAISTYPETPSTILGLSTVCAGQTDVFYIINHIINADNSVWNYSGTGATIVAVNDSVIKISYNNTSTSGILSVYGQNTLGIGPTTSIVITVNPLPANPGIISGLTTVCQGQNAVNYRVSLIANSTSFLWTLPQGTTGSSDSNNITINYGLTASSGNISIKGHNSCGDGDAANLIITVNPLPFAAGVITGLTTVCQGQNNVIYNIPVIANAPNYIWTLPNGATGISNSYGINVAYEANAVSGNIIVKGNNLCGDGNSSSLPIAVNLLPSAAGAISGITTVCQGQNNVTYTVPAITNAASYVWTMPDGVTGSSTTNIIALNYGVNALSGSITVRGHNSCGDGLLTSISITVNPLPLAATTITGLNSVCKNQDNVFYSVNSITNANTYIWSFPSGIIGLSSTNSITLDYGSTANSGIISVKGLNACGEGVASQLNITVSSAVVNAGSIIGLSTVCQGQSNVAYSVNNITNATSYIWSLPTGATGTSDSANIIINYGLLAASGNLSIKGHNLCGDGIATNLLVTVNPLPLDAGIVSGLTTVCQGQNNVTYTMPPIANANNYIWTLPNGATGTSNSYSINVSYSTNAVSGTIIVKGNNSCGDGNSSNIPINVNLIPSAAESISGITTVCQGQNDITYTVPAITNATSYLWTIPNGALGSSTSNNITINYGVNALSGNITVRGYNSCGEGILSTIPITVNPLPLAASTIIGLNSVCENQNNVIYNLDSISNADTYIWTLPTGTIGSSTTNTISVDYSSTANSGLIYVKGLNACGEGEASQLNIIISSPIVNIGIINGLTTVCQGQNNIVYSVNNIANASSYIWSLPTGTTGTSDSNKIIINYGLTAISGNISIKGHNSCGDGVAANLLITVNPLPLAAGVISGLTTVCQGQNNVIYNIPAITNATNYKWTLPSFATGSSNSYGIIASFGTNAVSGTIIVKGNNLCGDGNSSSLPINVNLLPSAAGVITGLTTVCQGQNNVTYTVPTITNATSYVWTMPNGTTGSSTSNNININYGVNALSGSITVRGYNSCGEGILSTIPITVNPLPLAATTIIGLNSVCENQNNVIYNVNSITNANTYIWTLPTGTTGSSTTNTISVGYSSTANSGLISVKGTNACGEGTASQLNIIVSSPVVNAGIINGLSTVCQGQNNIVYSVKTITNASSYIWSLPSGTTGTSTSNIIDINYGVNAQSGTISVKGTNICGDGMVSNLSITTNSPPGNAGIISGPTTVCKGSTNVVYTIPAITYATSYEWTLPSGATGISASNSILVNYNSNALDGNLTVKGINLCGESSEATLPITINSPITTSGIISGSTTVCQGQPLITYSTPIITNATSYIWTLPSNFIATPSTTNNITVNFGANSSNGNIAVKGANACGEGPSTILAIAVNANLNLPTAQIKICNDTLIDARNYQYDVYVRANTINGNTSVNLKGFQAGFQDSLKNVKGLGTPSLSIIPSSSNFGTNPDQRPVNSLLKPSVTNPLYVYILSTNIASNGMTIYDSTTDPLANSGWVKACSIKLTNTTDFLQAPMHVFYSKNNLYSTILLANYTNPCPLNGQIPLDTLRDNWSNPILNGILNTYQLTNVGTTLTLSGSQADGVIYYLYKNGVTSPISSKIGNGSSLIWSNINAGTYTVQAHRQATYMYLNMQGSVVAVTPPPLGAAQIHGASIVNQGQNNVMYYTNHITYAENTVWNYSGSGVSITSINDTTIKMSFGNNGTSGILSVYGVNSLGNGVASTLFITVKSYKRIKLTALIQGLYQDNHTMTQTVEYDVFTEDFVPKFTNPDRVDTLSILIRSASPPDYTIMAEYHALNLFPTGKITEIILPNAFISDNYAYIVINHRNSVEVWSDSVATADTLIDYNFHTKPISNQFFGNMFPNIDSYGNYTGNLIWSGDIIQDGIVNIFDLVDVFDAENNPNTQPGYSIEDINGDGIINIFDLVVVFDNMDLGVSTINPFTAKKK